MACILYLTLTPTDLRSSFLLQGFNVKSSQQQSSSTGQQENCDQHPTGPSCARSGNWKHNVLKKENLQIEDKSKLNSSASKESSFLTKIIECKSCNVQITIIGLSSIDRRSIKMSEEEIQLFCKNAFFPSHPLLTVDMLPDCAAAVQTLFSPRICSR